MRLMNVLVGFIAVTAAGTVPVAAQRFPFERSFDVGAASTLDVSTVRGTIEVSVGEPGRVLVAGTATVRIDWNVPADAVELARRVAASPPIRLDAQTLTLTPPSDFAERRAVTVSYQVTVPANTQVRTTSESGSTMVRDVSDAVTVRTQSGAITLEHLGGAADVASGSGAITIDGVRKALAVTTNSSGITARSLGAGVRVRTNSGAVTVELSGSGDADVETHSSAIHIDGARAGVKASSRSGRVSVSGVPARAWTAHSGSGGLDIAVESDASFSLDATTGSGSVSVDGATVQGTATPRKVVGDVGSGGGPLVRITSRSGSIRVRVGTPHQQSVEPTPSRAAKPDFAARDWPQWRGPFGSGVSPEQGLPTRWSDSENVAWKAPIRGAGISSPIVWGDLVIVTSQAGSGVVRPGPRLVQGGNPTEAGERALAADKDGTVVLLVTAFDRQTGDRKWEFSMPAEGDLPAVHEKHNLASPSPVTDGERIYAWFATGQIAAIDLTGKLVWTKNLGAEYGPFVINWGHGSSPVVHKSQLLLLCYHEKSSYLLALDVRTGAVRWKHDTDAGVTSYSTPLVVDSDGRAEVVINSSVGVSGHDLATGERLWHFDEANRFPIPTPVAQNGVIYTSRGYRSSPYMAIRAGGRGNVAESGVVWRVPSGAPYISSPVQHDGLIYLTGDVGVLTVTDAKTGERVYQERIGGVFTASPVIGDGHVYLVSEDGETLVLREGRTLEILARNRLSARQLASPAVAAGRLFIRSDDVLYAIGK